MSDIVVRAENLGKMYHIGSPQETYKTFRDMVARAVTAPFRRTRDLLHGQAYGAAGLREEIWALENVSFEVKQGEVVGIIGRNGAGKSTLLKILSRITEPTTGSVDIYGRIGALLEVGTGFHPELTGRENIYLNGAILGMSRQDINRKFDEIVDFAGVERFIDTPVKHYSSGMGLRLGFAVAAHLEPEILVVDEVLAVGDAEFQKKCLGKMSDVAGEGRTVLFVSHNMAAIRTLCSKVILLDKGKITYIGEVSNALHIYQEQITKKTRLEFTENENGIKFGDIKINNNLELLVNLSQPFLLSFILNINEIITRYSLFCIIKDPDNQTVVHSRVENIYMHPSLEPGAYKIDLQFPPLWLRPGLYTLQLKIIANKLGISARYLSDTELLDVTGTVEPPALLGYLTPNIDWKANRLAKNHVQLE